VYTIDRIKPVAICSVRVIPRRNPKFHMNEIEAGVGKSSRALLIIFIRGLLFISCVFIRMMKKSFDLDGVHEWKLILLIQLKGW